MKFAALWGVLLVTASVAAEDVEAPPETVESAAAPEAPPTLAESYDARVLYGLRQVVLRDFEGALATLRAAAQAEPGLPAAYCHLGAAQFEKGDLAEARAAYESCARFARLGSVGRYMSLAYVGLARAVERAEDTSPSERRDAWLRARDGAADDPTRALATARIRGYEAVLAREAAYVPVRERCAARRKTDALTGCL
jgi:tetratricopeptide (TPR) repeat protein